MRISDWSSDVCSSDLARLLEGSNILEIVYLGTNPDEARLISGLIRDTYLETSLNFRKNEARRNADWYQSQLEIAKRALASAENARTQVAQANGIVVSTYGAPVLAPHQWRSEDHRVGQSWCSTY